MKVELQLLMNAAWNGYKEICELLLNAGADVNIINKNNTTALMFAAQNGYEQICEIFLKREAKVNIVNENRWTALMVAAENGYKEIVKQLIAKKAEINTKDENGWTALMFAAQEGEEEVVKLLLKAGADMDTINKKGETALDIAKEKSYKSIVVLLEPYYKIKVKKANEEYDLRDNILSSKASNVASKLLDEGKNLEDDILTEQLEEEEKKDLLSLAVKNKNKDIIDELLVSGVVVDNIETEDEEIKRKLEAFNKRELIEEEKIFLTNRSDREIESKREEVKEEVDALIERNFVKTKVNGRKIKREKERIKRAALLTREGHSSFDVLKREFASNYMKRLEHLKEDIAEPGKMVANLEYRRKISQLHEEEEIEDKISIIAKELQNLRKGLLNQKYSTQGKKIDKKRELEEDRKELEVKRIAISDELIEIVSKLEEVIKGEAEEGMLERFYEWKLGVFKNLVKGYFENVLITCESLAIGDVDRKASMLENTVNVLGSFASIFVPGAEIGKIAANELVKKAKDIQMKREIAKFIEYYEYGGAQKIDEAGEELGLQIAYMLKESIRNLTIDSMDKLAEDIVKEVCKKIKDGNKRGSILEKVLIKDEYETELDGKIKIEIGRIEKTSRLSKFKSLLKRGIEVVEIAVSLTDVVMNNQ